MCGIFCLIGNKNCNENTPKEFEAIREGTLKRGPDYNNYRNYTFENIKVFLAASVLWLQGKNITKQPIEDDKSIFIYNGDIFGGDINNELKLEIGDTTLFHEALLNSNGKMARTLSNLHGPYAFIYLNKIENKLYFGRDIYGRRSLLVGKSGPNLVLSSVYKRNLSDFIELPSIGTFCYDLTNNKYYIYPWQYKNSNFEVKLKELQDFLGVIIEINYQIPLQLNTEFKNPLDLSCFECLSQENPLDTLLQDKQWFKSMKHLQNLLKNALQTRISTQPKHCKNCLKNKNNCNHSTTGVLFSGGIDCSILALLSDKYIDKNRPIDLINVAFDEKNNYQTPDRLTGLQTLQELQLLCPKRTWNFVSVNVTQKELNLERQNHIADLIYPLNTILDDSLGCALWFAARGRTSEYESPCRVLLVGMGADELFGGYTRHRAALKKDGWKGLHDVLNQDWQNISHRNLARDDRVVADHGRQLRTPFLDENVVEFVRNLHAWQKTYPSSDVPQGVGEKILLRSLGYHLGLKNAAVFKKRALQFGSRIANSKEHAHEISSRLIKQ
ncbi:unnamed protein product [Brassicogethes aeneus]|uniref:Glutamine amidotransferase type-2 domain-containing protein n=1 Tax=Brassicogethes aeneus TaxID=1431903 RepID=A0A9P0BLN4_BRAAE|nr:unnamed protein product [Brassicogethes aeneus]